MSAVLEQATQQPIKLDIGCGKNKKPGFYGVDILEFEGVDIVADLRQKRWSLKRCPVGLLSQVEKNGEVQNGEWRISFYEFPDGSVDEVHCSHFIEHLTNFGDKWERVNFFNELYRVMKVGAQCTLIFPHWSSARFYGDPTHKEPLSEWWSLYLDKNWRKANAPHCDSEEAPGPQSYSCDFLVTAGYSYHPSLLTRNAEYQAFATTHYLEARQDMFATLTKR